MGHHAGEHETSAANYIKIGLSIAPPAHIGGRGAGWRRVMMEGGGMKRIAAAAAVLAVVGLCGCNTVAGVGRDVSSVGHAVERAAK